jgi:hypothetical protein
MTSYIQNLEIHKGIQQLIPSRRETGKILLVLKSISKTVDRNKLFVKDLLENSHIGAQEANLGTKVCKNRMSWNWTRRVI